MTRLEKVVCAHLGITQVEDLQHTERKDTQVRLDAVTPQIMAELTAQDVGDHMRQVYDATVEEYLANPHTQYVIDELIEFMQMVPADGQILDIGCGVGRDTIFMSIGDADFRASLMQREKNGKKTVEKYSVPKSIFMVEGLDQAQSMLDQAGRNFFSVSVADDCDAFVPSFRRGDMHDLVKLYGIGFFNGVWSCAALFTHTPWELCEGAIRGVANLLKPGGIFFTSYTNGRADGRYNKLLFSSTGHIKYFSQPDPGHIAHLCSLHGLGLQSEAFSDYEIKDAIVKKDLFVSQFYVKKGA